MKAKGKYPVISIGLVSVCLIGLFANLMWPRFRFWYDFKPMGRNLPYGYLEYRHRRTGIVFVLLPGGKFYMGAQRDNPELPNYEIEAQTAEGPVHEVKLSPFLIAKYEVSQVEWERGMGKNPSASRGDNLPVEFVSWADGQEFCRKVGFLLPTEAQWEFACRGGTHGQYSGTGVLDDMGWYEDNSGRKPHPVGQKAPNGFGLYDIHGNVAEWCEDNYSKDSYSNPAARKGNPNRSSDACDHVIRGGNWNLGPRYCRSAFRAPEPRGDVIFPIGLRPVGQPP
jgi:formylglycine-generating enzyme required for sulfatase activity